MKVCEAIKELYPDWNKLEKGSWSEHGRIIEAADGTKIEIGLYREPADTEYNGTLTFQIFCNDDVMVCQQVSSYDPEDIEELWDEFGEVPMNPHTEKIETPWNGFPAGTDREDIWKWFDEIHPKGVHYLLYER